MIEYPSKTVEDNATVVFNELGKMIHRSPGICFLGWATTSIVAAAAGYGLMSDAFHLSHALTNSPYLYKEYVYNHLVIMMHTEASAAGTSLGTSFLSGAISLWSLYQLAERHFDNNRLAQLNS